jgi:hypothetical protein
MTLITNALALVSLAIIATAYSVSHYPRAPAFTTVTTLIFLTVFLSIIAGAVHFSAKAPEVSLLMLVGWLLLLWMGNQKIWHPEVTAVNAAAERMGVRP